MPRPRFSEMLLQRRRELGLTCSQASQILKLREDVLIAFEEGDWGRIPQSGYAQGMLSSYARYLGLNAREVVDLFQEELFEYQHGSSSHALRRRTRDTQMGRGLSGYDVPNEADSRPKAYVQYRPLLPTSGGPAGDMGDFATTTQARSRGSVPLAGTGTPAPGTRGYQYQPPAAPAQQGGYEQRRPYNAPGRSDRALPSTARRRSQQPARRRSATDPADRLLRDDQYAPGRGEWRRDDVSTRRVRPSEYTDDLRYDDRATSFAPASTISGRRSSRNIAPVERPNVRRRSSSAAAAGRSGRGGRRPPRRGGIVGAVSGFFSDPRRALLALVLLLAVALTAILLFSVSSCVGNIGNGGGNKTVQVNNATPSDSTSDEGPQGDSKGSSDGTDEPADSSSDTKDDAGTASDGEKPKDASGDDAASDEGTPAEEPEETVVEVSLASGQSAWVEIDCDGTSDADTFVGPWSKTYTVTDTITIQTSKPDAVTVTKNGEKVAFTSKVGGMGSLTFKGTPKPAENEKDAAGTDSTSGSGTTSGTTGTMGKTTTGAGA